MIITEPKIANKLSKENKDLLDKINKLEAFINSEAYKSLKLKEKFYLWLQKRVMTVYSRVLKKRAALNTKLIQDVKDKED